MSWIGQRRKSNLLGWVPAGLVIYTIEAEFNLRCLPARGIQNKTFSKNERYTPGKGNFTLFKKFPIAHSEACLTWELYNSSPLSHYTIMRNQKVIISRVQVFVEKVTMPWAISEHPRKRGFSKKFSSLSWSKNWNWAGPTLNVSKYSHSILPSSRPSLRFLPSGSSVNQFFFEKWQKVVFQKKVLFSTYNMYVHTCTSFPIMLILKILF